jgi:hypothetical protein
MLFPKDENAGGTWIGVSDKKRLVCVLNGGYVIHERKASYTKSRGLIAKDILKAEHLNDLVKELNLKGVEPFTMVIVDWKSNDLKLSELVWDESNVHFSKLPWKPKIWSSSTLYTEDIKAHRKKIFKKWLINHVPTHENILDFHHNQEGDKQQSFLMKRPYVETVSITAISIVDGQLTMRYEDIVNDQVYRSDF